jgi:hypothetical protein
MATRTLPTVSGWRNAGWIRRYLSEAPNSERETSAAAKCDKNRSKKKPHSLPAGQPAIVC